MSKERLKVNFKVDADKLPWKTGANGLFEYAELGPYCVYRDDAWGYYVTRDNSVVQWRTDLSRYAA